MKKMGHMHQAQIDFNKVRNPDNKQIGPLSYQTRIQSTLLNLEQQMDQFDANLASFKKRQNTRIKDANLGQQPNLLNFIMHKQHDKLDDLRQTVTYFEREILKIRETIQPSSANSSAIIEKKESVSAYLVEQTEALEQRIKKLRQFYIKCNVSQYKEDH